MTDTQHTPGPWYVVTDQETQYKWLVGDKNTWLPRIACIPPYTDPSVSANARLIAAAPELLDALWDIVEAEEHDGDASVCDFATLQSIARAAIIKATGGQS
jgi:hypothetical protein